MGPGLVLWLVLSACRAAGVEPLPRAEFPAVGPLRPTASASLAPGTYFRSGRDGAAIVIEDARDLVLDLRGVDLRGAADGTALDRYEGYGILIRRSSGIVLRGGALGGYLGCVVVEDSRDVRLENVSCEGYFGQRLLSGPDAEDPADWLRPHENDDGEWLSKYGAAIAVTDSERVTITGCRARRGQNGILLTRTTASAVHGNDMSFLSGWGLAMYRASRNQVSGNRFDYCVRGYSDGVYWRGQDSAGILMFERCRDNVIAHNSATHGGDGLFLFGGRELVEGSGPERHAGSDRNLFVANDFSFAVANAFEGTFSRDNVLQGNRLSGSHQHGVWGGYSSRMVLSGNEIQDNRGGGISIEHGQECVVRGNELRRNERALELWWDPDPEFVLGAFGASHDTASRDHWILGNVFEDNAADLVLRQTTGLTFAGNRFLHPGRGGEMDLAADSLREEGGAASFEELWGWFSDGHGQPGGELRDVSLRRYADVLPPFLEAALARTPPPLPPRAPMALDTGRATPGGLDTIVMGEWGPWDFESGAAPPARARPGGLLDEVAWGVRWFAWEGGPDPREDLPAWRALAERPAARGVLVGPWRGPRSGLDPAVPAEWGHAYYGLLADAWVRLEQDGRYQLSVVSDDGVRVRVDGEEVLLNWTWHAPTEDRVQLELEAGVHRIDLEYFQIDGASALSMRLDLVSDL